MQHNNHSNITLERNCWHHLRAFFINATTDELASHISSDLSTELKDVEARLRVKVRVYSIILAMDKCFSETSNYPQGCRKAFKARIEECHSSHLLHNVPSTKRNWQDIVYKCAGLAHVNRTFCVEFLDKKLRAYNKQSMLQENMLILLSSLAVTTMFRNLSILDAAIVMPVRWFTGHSYTLGKYGWPVYSMGRLLDACNDSMKELKANLSNITNEEFMMGIFNPY